MYKLVALSILVITLMTWTPFTVMAKTRQPSTPLHSQSKIHTLKHKPQAPIKTEAKLLNNPDQSENAQIELSVVPLIDAPKLTISCKLPEELHLTKGSEEWNGQGHKNKKIVLQYEIPLNSDIHYEIVFTASIEAKGFKAASRSVVDLNPSKKKITKPSPRVIKKLPNGGTVIEMRGE